MNRGDPRIVRDPEIVFQLQSGKRLTLEFPLERDGASRERWELFALLRNARRLRQLLVKAEDALASYNLLAQDPAIQELLSLVQQIPQQAQREMDAYVTRRQPVQDFHQATPTPPPRKGFGLFP